MRKLIGTLSVIVLWPLATSWAQLVPPNENGVSMGHIHIMTRDVEVEKKAWVGLGGIAIKIDGIDVIKYPGVFVFIQEGVTAYNADSGTGVTHFVKPDGARYANWGGSYPPATTTKET